MNTEQNLQNNQLLEEAERLIWALLDEQINESDIKHLESLIQENQAVRNRYLQCVQIHADLYSHFRPATSQTAGTGPNTQSPVLETLLSDLSLPQGGSSSLTD